MRLSSCGRVSVVLETDGGFVDCWPAGIARGLGPACVGGRASGEESLPYRERAVCTGEESPLHRNVERGRRLDNCRQALGTGPAVRWSFPIDLSAGRGTRRATSCPPVPEFQRIRPPCAAPRPARRVCARGRERVQLASL